MPDQNIDLTMDAMVFTANGMAAMIALMLGTGCDPAQIEHILSKVDERNMQELRTEAGRDFAADALAKMHATLRAGR